MSKKAESSAIRIDSEKMAKTEIKFNQDAVKADGLEFEHRLSKKDV